LSSSPVISPPGVTTNSTTIPTSHPERAGTFTRGLVDSKRGKVNSRGIAYVWCPHRGNCGSCDDVRLGARSGRGCALAKWVPPKGRQCLPCRELLLLLSPIRYDCQSTQQKPSLCFVKNVPRRGTCRALVESCGALFVLQITKIEKIVQKSIDNINTCMWFRCVCVAFTRPRHYPAIAELSIPKARPRLTNLDLRAIQVSSLESV
jgi:hypothetical protein